LWLLVRVCRCGCWCGSGVIRWFSRGFIVVLSIRFRAVSPLLLGGIPPLPAVFSVFRRAFVGALSTFRRGSWGRGEGVASPGPWTSDRGGYLGVEPTPPTPNSLWAQTRTPLEEAPPFVFVAPTTNTNGCVAKGCGCRFQPSPKNTHRGSVEEMAMDSST
jgi:hypothetical protein